MTDADLPLERQRAPRRQLPPDEAWPLALLTSAGWYLLTGAGIAWLALGPLKGPPLPPGEDPPTGMAGFGYGLDRLFLELTVPAVLIGVVVSATICLAGRDCPGRRLAVVARGTGAYVLGVPAGLVLWLLVLALASTARAAEPLGLAAGLLGAT